MLAKVGQRDLLRQLVDHERRCRRGEQHLATVAGGHDSCRSVDDRAEVVPGPPVGFTRMQGHADAQGAGLRPWLVQQRMLGRDAGIQRTDRGSEDRHHPVAGSLYDFAVRAANGASEDRVVPL